MIYSFVGKRVEDLTEGQFATGVTRFDQMLRLVFPELVSISSVTGLPLYPKSDVVITDNHLSLQIPEHVPTVVVHHGCAKTHYERDMAWRNERTRSWVNQQRLMFTLPNRIYVAPSAWVGNQFRLQHQLSWDYCTELPHWVPLITRKPPDFKRAPVVIGDWRDSNKGAGLWKRVAANCAGVAFVPLNFRTLEEKIALYSAADLYLCLSLSEGGSYAMADAEASRIPILTTPVGNYQEYGFHEIPLAERNDAKLVAAAIRRALVQADRRGGERGYFEVHTFAEWASAWCDVVDRARRGADALLM